MEFKKADIVAKKVKEYHDLEKQLYHIEYLKEIGELFSINVDSLKHKGLICLSKDPVLIKCVLDECIKLLKANMKEIKNEIESF